MKKKLSIIILSIILAASLAFAVPPSPPSSTTGATINDSAGNGDNTVVYSADKVFDLLALKEASDAGLTAIAALANGAGALTNDGAGVFSYVAYDVNGVVSHSSTENATAAQMKGQTHLVTGAYTVSLPTAAVGYKAKFRATTAAVYSLDVVTGTDVIRLNGTALTAGYKVTSDGTINNTIECECSQAGYYDCNSLVGVATDGGI